MQRLLGSMSIGLVLILGPSLWAADWHGGVGVIGDSYSDEYEFYPTDRSEARNWVEILAETRGIDFGPFSREGRAAPRLQGYAYNWARSDATTTTMIAQGQHTGVAEQVAHGQVGLVWIFIGGNDFIAAIRSQSPVEAASETASRAIANLDKAITTVLAASPDVKIVVLTVPDITELPDVAEAIQSGAIRREGVNAVTRALQEYNDAIHDWPNRDHRVSVVDLHLLLKLAASVSQEKAYVAGRWVDRQHCGNDLDHLFLNDHRHVGTLAQGLLAQIFVTTVNSRYGAHVSPLSNSEIVAYANRVGGHHEALVQHETSAPRAQGQ